MHDVDCGGPFPASINARLQCQYRCGESRSPGPHRVRVRRDAVQKEYRKLSVRARHGERVSVSQPKKNHCAFPRVLSLTGATRQSGAFNVAYAASLGHSATTSTVLELVSDNTFNFGSAAWYYTAPAQDGLCASTRAMAQGPGSVDADAWFTSYVLTCVSVGAQWNTTSNSVDSRWAYWERAKVAYSIS